MVGDFEVIALYDGISIWTVDQQIQLLQATRIILKIIVYANPDEQIEKTVNAYLINTGSKLILVDAGYGKMDSATMEK